MRRVWLDAMVVVSLLTSLSVPVTSSAQSAASVRNIAKREKAADQSERENLKGVMTLFNSMGVKSRDSVEVSMIAPPALAPRPTQRRPYVGAQLGYAFGDDKQFASNLVASGSLMYSLIDEPADGDSEQRFFIPVRGNFSSLAAAADTTARSKKIEDLVAGSDGMRIAIEPYYQLKSIGNYVRPTILATAGWRLNAAKDKTDTTRYLALGRISAGLEIGIGSPDAAKLPMTIAANWAYSSFAGQSFRKVLGDEAKSRVTSGEFTIVVPTSDNSAFVTEAIATAGQRPVWRLGLMFLGSGKEK